MCGVHLPMSWTLDYKMVTRYQSGSPDPDKVFTLGGLPSMHQLSLWSSTYQLDMCLPNSMWSLMTGLQQSPLKTKDPMMTLRVKCGLSC